jgi:hypothetical protein
MFHGFDSVFDLREASFADIKSLRPNLPALLKHANQSKASIVDQNVDSPP